MRFFVRRKRWAGRLIGTAWLASGCAYGAVLHVGPGEPYKTVAAGIAAARDDDTVLVDAGTYENDFAVVSVRLTLRANGGRVTMRGSEAIPNNQGILVTQADVSIDGFTFTGARASKPAGANGAGIRYLGGRLVVANCWFTHNQDGLFANPSAGGTITILNSQFDHNGHHTGPQAGHTHNLYVDTIARLDVENSYFTQAIEGHEIKSRALVTLIRHSRIVDGPGSTASYSVDLPNGGDATLTDLKIEQGADSANPVMIAYGEEGGLLANSQLRLTGSLLENDLTRAVPVGVWNASDSPVTLTRLRVFGLTSAELVSGPATVTHVRWLDTEPRIGRRHPF